MTNQMTNAFLPFAVHYPNDTEYKNAVEMCNSNKYDAIYFDPKHIEDEIVFVILETENDTRILRTHYDTTLDRFFPSENDTLHLFENRSSAFRYLAKVTRTWKP